MADKQTAIAVSVVYATPIEQKIVTLDLTNGDTVEKALELVRSHFSELELSAHTVGVFGAVQDRSAVLNDGDRLEIYRPLQNDAKEARRRRALEQQKRLPTR